MRTNRLSSFLAPIRIRYLLLVAAVLGLIFFAFAFQGIREARQSLLKIMVNEGRALVESLALSSANAIQARFLLESLAEEKFIDLAQMARGRLLDQYNSDNCRRFRDENNLLSIDFLDSNLTIITSDRWAEGFRPDYPPEVNAEIRDIQTMGGGYRSVLIYGDTLQPLIQYFIYAFAVDGEMVVFEAEASYLGRITQQIGIGYLIRQLASQIGISHIILQSREGIIFSSKPLMPIPSIESDPFLDSLMRADSIGWRILKFEGTEILEVSRLFESAAYPPGMYRIGLSLDDYHDISRQYVRQFIITAVVLFLLTLLVVAIVSINQNYFILDQSFKQIRSVSETVFDRLSGAVMAYDRDEKVIAANKAFINLAGLEIDIVGQKLSDIKAELPFDLPDSPAEGENVAAREQEISDGTGQTRHLLLGISSLPDDAGGGAVVLIHDITEQKKTEEENRRKERLSEMGDMAAGVAHEIRNPLNAIAIAAQRLEHEFKPADDLDDYQRLTKNILSESERLNQILTRFLELTRTRAAENKPMNLVQPITKAIAIISDEAKQKGIDINYSEPEKIIVRGEADKFQQVFINLLKNSIQAIPENSNGAIMVRVIEKDNQIIVTVSDSGPGFSPDELSKIFQPYFTTKTDGSGLGLALAYKTITDFGGTIEATNNPDGGARLEIKLPKV